MTETALQTPSTSVELQEVSNTKLLNLVIKGTPVVTATAIACGCVFVGLNNPETKSFLAPCGFYAATGLYCPGCGMTRALHSVLNGNILKGIQFNAILVLALPVLMYFYVWWTMWAFTGRKMPTFTVSKKVAWALVAAAVIFAVGRNLPGAIPLFFARDRV